MKNTPTVEDLVLLVVFKRFAADPLWGSMFILGDSQDLDERRLELELGLRAAELFVVIFSVRELENRLLARDGGSAWDFVVRSNSDPCVRFA
jgi:hypothetical protein